MTTLVDANILIDVMEDDLDWAAWSSAQLQSAGREGPLLIGDVVYAEISGSFENGAALDHFLDAAGIERVAMLPDALFLAGKVHRCYRAAGGPRLSLLPDFFIGAQAATLGLPLMTRDVQRYRRYFPTVRLIAPSA